MWLLDWCADEGFNKEIPHDKETFRYKEDMFDRLEDLKYQFGDILEYRYGKAKKIKTIKYVFDD